MTRRSILFAVTLLSTLLTCCAQYSPSQSSNIANRPIATVSSVVPGISSLEPGIQESPESEEEPEEPPVALRSIGLSPEDVVEAYLADTYESYIGLEYTDITCYLDMEQRICQSANIWLQYLTQRRRLIDEYDFCYVETEMFPYTIEFIGADELSDDRVNFWSNFYKYDENEIMLHFIVEGEKGKAYPPLLAVNSEHTMRLKKIDGEWYITFHYFPGSRRKFTTGSAGITIPSEEVMLEELFEEFGGDPAVPINEDYPVGALPYRGDLSAEYAMLFTEEKNPDFYDIGDWMGNCSNFTSQCIWAGFRSENTSRGIMTNEWYAGGGGGSPAWENVGYFWRYAVEAGGLNGQVLPGVNALIPGDLIQTSSLYNNRVPDPAEENGERYNHSLIVIDAETLLLAQNSPSCFVYYSDILNVEARFFRPGYLFG